VRYFIEPDLSDNNAPFDNTTPIYLINLPWKLGLGLGLDLIFTILAFFTENNENEYFTSANFTEDNIVLKERTHSINNKMKLYILEVPVNKLGNWLIQLNGL